MKSYAMRKGLVRWTKRAIAFYVGLLFLIALAGAIMALIRLNQGVHVL